MEEIRVLVKSTPDDTIMALRLGTFVLAAVDALQPLVHTPGERAKAAGCNMCVCGCVHACAL